MQQLLPSHVELIGMHPMFGPDSFSSHQKHPLVICPVRATTATVEQWIATTTSMGCRPIQMSSDHHDQSVAYIQGFSHLIGRTAQHMQLAESPIATLGYQKILALMQQTCNDSEQLFVDLQQHNPYTPQMLQSFETALSHVKKKIGRVIKREGGAGR